MALTLKSPREVQLIVSSFRKVFQNNDIEHLTKAGYNYIYLAPGFIAHYNLVGFRDYYLDVKQLRYDIIDNHRMNQWNNFTIRDAEYAYYMQKRDIYNQILNLVK